ncbi:MAG: diaminopimelate epimerase [Candidatus Omnitrophica bacterium]|nr:diaminopimelate epimerase [Candidatus Omnitrophota bacterium]
MKKINFTKMAGAGNDFIVIDAAPGLNYKKLAGKACDRTKGIGADGLLVLDKSRKADYRMRIINSDGSEAEMCGNGARCIAAYIVRNKKPRKKLFTIETLAGIISAMATGEVARVQLSAPDGYQADITLTVNGRAMRVSYIDTGVPHVVVFVDGLEGIDVAGIGRVVRYHDRFQPRGTNVDFVEQVREDLVSVRTYERGVEDETKACGTGSVAAAVVACLKANPDARDKKAARMNVRTASGEVLEVSFDINGGEAANVWLKGSANFIARGEYYV